MKFLKFILKIDYMLYFRQKPYTPEKDIPNFILNKIDIIYDNDQEKKKCYSKIKDLIEDRDLL